MRRLLALILVVFSMATLGLWRSQQIQVLSVQTGSMAPLLKPGDAVLAKKTDPQTVNAGDIISYRSAKDPAVVLTHRVVNIDHQSGQMTAQGDANVTADQPASTAAIVGAVQYRLPAAGYVIDFMRSWTGLVLAVYIPSAIILSSELYRLGRFYLLPTYQLRY